ncbi:uncharacterized protein TNCV_3143401 [Trichonephila clavipes]|nr:uncharacterized protein TNCV_3143401 [Trichonephila clavipes]
MSIRKFKKEELKSIAEELKLVVLDNAKALDLRELIQESEIYKNDKETYQPDNEGIENNQNNGKVGRKRSRNPGKWSSNVEKQKGYKVTNPFISTNDPVLYFPHQVIIKNESLTTKQQIVFDASASERRVLKEEMGSKKSDEDTELPQATERVLPLESERAKMLSVCPDAMAQPVTVPEEKCLPRALLISADEMCEEKEERSVDVIKETAKENINPVVLSREPLNLNNDEIEEIKHRKGGLSRI